MRNYTGESFFCRPVGGNVEEQNDCSTGHAKQLGLQAEVRDAPEPQCTETSHTCAA